jgi:hypothetical protein
MPAIKNKFFNLNRLVLLCVLFLTVITNAQIRFEKGSFTNSQSQTVECLIKNYDWNFFPSDIEYKTSENDQVNRISIANVQSFQIYETSHNYKKFDVPVLDKQAGDVTIKSGKQLLKVLVKGSVSLLIDDQGIYYLENEQKAIVPLIYAKYINKDTRTVDENNDYRTQLFYNLKCEGFKQDAIRKVIYSENKLVGLVNDYNACKNLGSNVYIAKKTKAEFNLKVLAGVNFYKPEAKVGGLNFVNSTYTLSGEGATNFAIGFEAELKLPINRHKWSVFTAPIYNRHKELKSGSVETVYDYVDFFGYRGQIILSDFSYIEIPLGIKHYFYLNQKSSLNISVAYGITVEVPKSKLTFVESMDYGEKLILTTDDSSNLLRFGAGYTFDNTYGIQVNFYPIKSYSNSNTDSSFNILLSYKIL